MQTDIKQVSPVNYELVIEATAEDLEPDFNRALKKQRAETHLKGFRPGKVPVQLIKKRFGEAIAFGVAEQLVQDVYEDLVLEDPEYDVLGRPVITAFEYQMDGDLKATIAFGVRPKIEIADLSEVSVSKLQHTVTDEEIEEAIERLRIKEADLIPVEGEAVGEEDYVVFDVQEIDTATNTAIVGSREEDQTFFVDDLDEVWKSAFVGKNEGETFRVDLSHDGEHGEVEARSSLIVAPDAPEQDHSHVHRFEVTLKEIKRRELPELDEDFIAEVTNDEHEDEAGLRAFLTAQIAEVWERESRSMLEDMITEKMIELHPTEVPNSVVETYLDYYLEDVKQRNEGDLPEDFDEAAFRAANRENAEGLARWMMIRDQLVSDHNLEVTEEDRDTHFEEFTKDGNLDVGMIRQYYSSLPGMMDRLDEQLLSKKVFDLLLDQLNIVEKDDDAFGEEMDARRAAAETAATDEAEPAAEEA